MGLRWLKRGFMPLFIGTTVGFALSLLLRSISTSCSVRKDTSLPLFTFSADSHEEYPGQNIGLVAPKELSDHLNLIDINGELNTNDQPRLVLVGIMTAHKFLHTRAVGVYETWGSSENVKIIFFTGGDANKSEDTIEEGPSNPPPIPLVALPGVDDSYPPQRKSFMMIKYMYDHYGDKFEWFLRGDDDVYMKTDKLSQFLRSINSNESHFIGQAGRGNRLEKGTLNLAHDENFCMGGPGIIFSRAALAKVVPHIQECLRDMYSTHEDVEIGRCVHRFAGISCTWAFEMQAIFYHNSSGELAFTSFLKQREVHRAISLHPIKDYRHLYRIHAYFQGLKIQDSLFESVQIHRDLLLIDTSEPVESILDVSTVPHSSINNITGLRPSLDKFHPREAGDILKWNFIGKTGFHSVDYINPKQKADDASKEALSDMIRELMDIINGFSKVRGRVIEFKELLYGYHRTSPLYGEDFVLDLLMTYKKYRGKKMTIPVRRHAYIQRTFPPLQMRRITDDKLLKSTLLDAGRNLRDVQQPEYPTNIVMIVPLAGRIPTFERFLQNFIWSCENLIKTTEKKNNDKWTMPELTLSLFVVYFGSDEEKTNFQSLINSYRQNRSVLINSTSSDAACQIRVIQVYGEFSRGIALETGISQCNKNDLVFLIDVDIVFSSGVLERVILNTVQGERVYFPIVFSEYDPKLFPQDLKDADKFEISNDRGYWREYGFGIAAFYKSDFQTVGGFDTKIHGWGKEDVQLFDKFVRTNLTVFRAPDPELLHLYHSVHCDPKLSHSQHEMCLGTQANTLASVKTLMELIFQKRKMNKRLQKLSAFIS